MKYFIIGMLVLLGIILTDVVFSTSTLTAGVVVDKQYQSEQTHVGVGNGVSTNGTSSQVVTTSTTPEQFLLIVRNSKQKIVTVECTPELYYSKEKEDELEYNIKNGYITGLNYGYNGVR